jgi:hypothetical protein
VKVLIADKLPVTTISTLADQGQKATFAPTSAQTNCLTPFEMTKSSSFEAPV